MRRVLVTSVVLLITVFVWAQQDQKAKDILDKVSEKTRSYSTITADFSFSMQNKELEIDEKNDGSIKIKGQKYCVNLPDVNGGIKVFSDGKTLWNYMKNGNQVTISNLDEESSDLMDPSTLFSIYEKGFDSKFVAEKKDGNITIYQIDLFPDSKEHDVAKISVSINKSTMTIHSAILYGTDDNLYIIEVKKMETDKELPDSEFVFDASKFPDVDEIDFR